MLNTVKLALAATLAAATGTLATFADDVAPAPKPESGLPMKLISDDLSNPFGNLLAEATQDKRVTVRIQGTIEDVIKWMGDTGISFVLENQNLSSRKVTINIVDQPVEDAIAAIAEALGTGWSKRGQVYVLGTKDALAPRVWSVPGAPIAPKALSPEARVRVETEVKRAEELAKKARENAKYIAPEVFTWRSGLSEKDRKELEQQMKKLHELKDLSDVRVYTDVKGLSDKERKEFELQMKKLHELKELSDVRVYTDVKSISEKERKALEESLKGLKSMPHIFIREGREMTPAERKKFEESMRKLEVEMKELGDDMKVYTVPPMTGQQRKELEGKWFSERDLPKAPAALRTGTMEELMKSLTPDQRMKHEQQGFLKFSDLSGGQKKMLGSPKGNFTISFNLNGKQLTIKNP